MPSVEKSAESAPILLRLDGDANLIVASAWPVPVE